MGDGIDFPADFPGYQKIIQPPAIPRLPLMETMAPPGVGPGLFRVKMAVNVHKPAFQQILQAGPFL